MTFPARGENVKLGKGSVLLNLYDENGQLGGADFVGNCSAVAIATAITNVEMYSNTQRTGNLVARDRTRIAYTLTLTAQEFTINNLKLFLLATEASNDQFADTAVTASFPDIVLGKYYDLDARRVTNFAAHVGSVLLVAGTDYTINSEYGIVQFLSTSADVGDGDDVDVTFDQPSLSISSLQLGKASSQLAKLLYLSDDANSSGKASKDKLTVWKADVAPDGDLNLISDDYGSFNLTMPILSDETNHPNDPYGKLERIAA